MIVHAQLLAIFRDGEYHSISEIERKIPGVRELTRRIRELSKPEFGQRTVVYDTKRKAYHMLDDVAGWECPHQVRAIRQSLDSEVTGQSLDSEVTGQRWADG